MRLELLWKDDCQGGCVGWGGHQRNALMGQWDASRVDGERQIWCLSESVQLGRRGQENGTCQCFSSQRKFLLIPAPSALATKLVNKSPLGLARMFFKLLPVCCSWNESVCMGLLTAKSWFPVALRHSWSYAPLIFKTRHYGSSSSQCRSPSRACLILSLNPLLLREDLTHCDIPPTCGSLCWGMCPNQTTSLCLLPFLMCFFFMSWSVKELFCQSSGHS